jgi:hypothetical protein
MPTANELSKLADSLSAAAQAIDDRVNTTMDPLSPQGQHLKDISAHIAHSATQVRALAIAALAPDVAGAVNDLTSNMGLAKATLDQIKNVQKILSIAAAVLSVAAAVATKDPFGAAQGVINLISIIEGALGKT